MSKTLPLVTAYVALPQEEKGEACELLKQAKDEPYVEDRINLTNMVLSKISSNIGRIIIYTEELNMVKKIQVTGSSGITAGGNVTFGDVSGQLAVGQNITQTQSIGQTDLEELRKSLLDFQKEVAKLSLSSEDQSIVSGKISEAVKEAKKDNPALPTIKERFESAVNTVKEAGKAVKDISELYEPAKKIAKLVGIGLLLLL